MTKRQSKTVENTSSSNGIIVPTQFSQSGLRVVSTPDEERTECGTWIILSVSQGGLEFLGSECFEVGFEPTVVPDLLCVVFVHSTEKAFGRVHDILLVHLQNATSTVITSNSQPLHAKMV
jgi:hypothetical protein